MNSVIATCCITEVNHTREGMKFVIGMELFYNYFIFFFNHNLQMSAKFQIRVKTVECVPTNGEVTLAAVNLDTTETTVNTVIVHAYRFL